MQMFRSHGIRETAPSARTPSYSYRRSWFGLRRQMQLQHDARTPAGIDADADAEACVAALAYGQPAQWEDLLVCYERAA